MQSSNWNKRAETFKLIMEMFRKLRFRTRRHLFIIIITNTGCFGIDVTNENGR